MKTKMVILVLLLVSSNLFAGEGTDNLKKYPDIYKSVALRANLRWSEEENSAEMIPWEIERQAVALFQMAEAMGSTMAECLIAISNHANQYNRNGDGVVDTFKEKGVGSVLLMDVDWVLAIRELRGE